MHLMDPKDYFFKLPKKDPPTNIKIPELWYPNVKTYWDRCTSTRRYNPIFGMKAVVIHATAGSSSAGAVSVMRDGRASFHWLIPDEDEDEHGKIIWACAPETLAAWHVRNSVHHPLVNDNKNLVNHWSLGIELVNTQVNDPFSDWQVKMAADIVKYCWAKYPNLEYIVSHAMLDPTRRTDPGVQFPWEDFKAQVLDEGFDHLLVNEDIIEAHDDTEEHDSIEGDLCC